MFDELNIEYWILNISRWKEYRFDKAIFIKVSRSFIRMEIFFFFFVKIVEVCFYDFFFLERIKLDIKKDVDSISSNFLKL